MYILGILMFGACCKFVYWIISAVFRMFKGLLLLLIKPRRKRKRSRARRPRFEQINPARDVMKQERRIAAIEKQEEKRHAAAIREQEKQRKQAEREKAQRIKSEREKEIAKIDLAYINQSLDDITPLVDKYRELYENTLTEKTREQAYKKMIAYESRQNRLDKQRKKALYIIGGE